MNVTVTDNKMETITYGYSPEHFASVVEFYSGLVQDGSIYTYTVKMQCVGLDIPPEIWDPRCVYPTKYCPKLCALGSCNLPKSRILYSYIKKKKESSKIK